MEYKQRESSCITERQKDDKYTKHVAERQLEGITLRSYGNILVNQLTYFI